MSRHSVRIFGLRYRKSGDVMFREKECNCDREPDGIHGVGDVWHEEKGNDVWVKLAVDYFETPSSTGDMERVDKIFQRCELDAERWVQSHYPDMTLT